MLMNARVNTVIASIICLTLILVAVAGFSQPEAQAQPAEQSGDVPAEFAHLADRFDIPAATAFARANIYVYHGYCADFVFLILHAGGFTIFGDENRFRAYTQYDHLVNELGFRSYFLGNGSVTQNAEKIEEGDVVMWDLGYMLSGITDDIVSIRGSGGHIVYISMANGPNSRFIGRNPEQLDALLVTGGNHGMWLIKTSVLAGNDNIRVSDVTPFVYQARLTGTIHMTPNGEYSFDADGNLREIAGGEAVRIDRFAIAGGYMWGRIVNDGWDWIIITPIRARPIILGFAGRLL